LGFQIAGFAARAAIVLAVFTQADVIVSAAQDAILHAGAAPLRRFANSANIILRHRQGSLARFDADGQYAVRAATFRSRERRAVAGSAKREP